MSTIANGFPGNRPRALSSITNPVGRPVSPGRALYQTPLRSAIGKESISALPRPERLGLVMK